LKPLKFNCIVRIILKPLKINIRGNGSNNYELNGTNLLLIFESAVVSATFQNTRLEYTLMLCALNIIPSV